MNNDNNKNDTFCILPWIHTALNSTGYLRLCCNSTPGKNILVDDNGKKLHISHIKSLSDVENIDWLKKIRASMLKDEKVSICERCYREEEAGISSARTGWNAKFQKFIEPATQKTKSDGTTDFYKPIYMDLRLGNLCNLKCRMCNPYSSKRWLEDWNQIYEDKRISYDERQRLESLKWFSDEKTWDLLGRLSDSAEEIYFTGGEPFLISQQIKMLDFLIEKKSAEKIKLKYNTNLTILPQKVIDRWKHFRSVAVNVSIDAVGDLNNYIRNPSKWEDIDANLTILDELVNTQQHITVSVHTTVQIYNVNKILDIITYLEKFKNIAPIPYWNILNHPNYLNIKLLPSSFKTRVAKEISLWIEKNEGQYTSDQSKASLRKLADIEKYMLAGEPLSNKEEFRKYSQLTDEARQESLKTSNPEVYNAFF